MKIEAVVVEKIDALFGLKEIGLDGPAAGEALVRILASGAVVKPILRMPREIG